MNSDPTGPLTLPMTHAHQEIHTTSQKAVSSNCRLGALASLLTTSLVQLGKVCLKNKTNHSGSQLQVQSVAEYSRVFGQALLRRTGSLPVPTTNAAVREARLASAWISATQTDYAS